MYDYERASSAMQARVEFGSVWSFMKIFFLKDAGNKIKENKIINSYFVKLFEANHLKILSSIYYLSYFIIRWFLFKQKFEILILYKSMLTCKFINIK